MSSETVLAVLIITDIPNAEILPCCHTAEHVCTWLACLQPDCSTQDQSPLLFLFLWGLSSWLQQARWLARTSERSCSSGQWSLRPACLRQRGRNTECVRRWHSKWSSQTLSLCKFGVLTVTGFRSALDSTYLHHLYILFSQKFKKKNYSNREIDTLWL